ncbi:Trypanosomal VSG domain containing protein, putative [Trypanosoma equiperdum]|uniref:Trypanosomal VSG domain containing protein, putative n=1 Tax=Trypanosoma equiperdum TaxID=5694 RepID=A0A1G4I8B9_TRYEQ|nr:Trypanosomal VSG domain containing protein, putative [Trypanosoma equiperdum]
MTVSTNAPALTQRCGLLRAQPMLLITLAATATLLIARPVSSAGPNAGQNRQTFGFLCSLVLAAELDNQKLEPSNAAVEAITTSGHISTILAQPDDVAKLQAVIGKAPTAANGSDQLPDSCKAEKAVPCKQAASWLASLPADERQKVIRASKDDRGFKQKINATVNAIKKLGFPDTQLASPGAGLDVASKLRKAVYGGDGSIPKMASIPARTDRATSCGNANSAVGEAATRTVAATIACLCASSSATGSSNTGCYTPATDEQAFDGTSDEIKGWQTILAECKKLHPNYNKMGYTQVPIALTALKAELFAAKGSGADKIGILGAIQGDGSGACDGQHASNKGACASFRTAANTVAAPTWMTTIEEAIADMEQQKTRAKNAIIAEAQVHALNETLTTLLNLNAMEALKQQDTSPTQAPQTPSGDSKKQQEESEEKCKNLDTKTNCNQHKNPKCKWTKPDVEAGKYCELNETKVAEQPTQAGAGQQTSKCTGQDTKEKCEAVQGTAPPGKKSVCGWITYEDGKGTLEKPYCRCICGLAFLIPSYFSC